MCIATEKLFYYLDTFDINNGRKTARKILWDEIRKDIIEEKMKTLRSNNNARIMREKNKDVDPYETAAKAFYRKYGTKGEF